MSIPDLDEAAFYINAADVGKWAVNVGVYTVAYERVSELEAENAELRAEVEELKTEKGLDHTAPDFTPTTALEALDWIDQDRGYGMWSSADACRFSDAVQLVQAEVEKLQGILRVILNDATASISNPDKRVWPIRALHYRDGMTLLEAAEAAKENPDA